jgi:hypothetical protein
MQEATNTPTTPPPLGDRYVPATVAVTVRFRVPQSDRRRRVFVTGTLKGAMHMRGAVHHYRVAGADGVLYLAPVAWFPPGHVEWFTKAAFVQREDPAKQAQINALIAKLVSLSMAEPVA